ncbi:MAG: CBS domain-containing protein, partial [Candidatus Dormibacteraeota bacterium]|nr:CBS domain-containing protein [Candidatus Dormibacteraeota bacterium]
MTEAVAVRNLMHSPPVTVSAGAPVAEVVRLLNEEVVGAAAVVDSDHNLVGMITERDVLRAVGAGVDPASATVESLMTRAPVTIEASDSASAALQLFSSNRFRHLPVMDASTVVGILSIRHVVRLAHIEDVRPAGSAPQLAPAGLEGVAVAETAVGDVRGEEGFFHYRGYDAAELARRCSFEQVWHLLIKGKLPDDAELAAFKSTITELRSVPDGMDDVLRAISTVPGYRPLPALSSAVSALSSALGLQSTLDLSAEQIAGDCLAVAALVPMLLLRIESYRRGQEPVDPDPDLGYAAAYLQMLTGKRPSEADARALERYLVLTMDHGFNSSTFTARVITSTGSDVGSAVAGAVGALAGPLHGGAPSRALAMLDAIQE